MKIQVVPVVFLNKSLRWLLTSSSMLGTSVLGLSVSELPQLSFHRLLIVSSFWNHKTFMRTGLEGG